MVTSGILIMNKAESRYNNLLEIKGNLKTGKYKILR